MELKGFRDILVGTGIPVFHFVAKNKACPYLVWAEDGQEDASYNDNVMTSQYIGGSLDYYTKDEYDPNVGKIQQALNTGSTPWKLNSIQYEEENGIIHYEWYWKVMNPYG